MGVTHCAIRYSKLVVYIKCSSSTSSMLSTSTKAFHVVDHRWRRKELWPLGAFAAETLTLSSMQPNFSSSPSITLQRVSLRVTSSGRLDPAYSKSTWNFCLSAFLLFGGGGGRSLVIWQSEVDFNFSWRHEPLRQNSRERLAGMKVGTSFRGQDEHDVSFSSKVGVRFWVSKLTWTFETGLSFQVALNVAKLAWVSKSVWTRLRSQCGHSKADCRSRVECILILVGLAFHRSQVSRTLRPATSVAGLLGAPGHRQWWWGSSLGLYLVCCICQDFKSGVGVAVSCHVLQLVDLGWWIPLLIELEKRADEPEMQSLFIWTQARLFSGGRNRQGVWLRHIHN